MGATTPSNKEHKVTGTSFGQQSDQVREALLKHEDDKQITAGPEKYTLNQDIEIA